MLTLNQKTELTGLVQLCGKAYGFTQAEFGEALQVALADPESALICFRAMAREIQLANPCTTNPERKSDESAKPE